jgi:hypothetical protein
MAYDNDSAILEVRTTENGYTIELSQWSVSPPPGGAPPPAVRADYIATDKADLKAKLALWVDNLFDQG